MDNRPSLTAEVDGKKGLGIGAEYEEDEGRLGRLPCSQNAHAQKVLVRCAQSKANHVCPQGVDKRGLNILVLAQRAA